ncbi:glycosyltransferase [Limobrevibacterium gyesilva]|uniref:Glycosyltransferase n=1 Tax=Limobrevibacterium gyesilva TaxID=2991712 RepID=A0AA41YNP5_9PROT|nr:glycosyltransferase [Limobrevibacterium gyesilva]MCW3476889.1 glycosyltransferase [Limobrevibacterium gyesilva]
MAAPLLLHVYATFAVGGPQVRFAAVANRFGRRWRHAIVAMDGDLACRERLSPGLDVAFPRVDIRKGDTLGNVRRFRAMLRALRPDALITSNWGSIEWAMANALPLARHIHVEDGFGPEERAAQIPRRVLLRRLFLRRATVVVPSRVLWRIATGTWRLDVRRVRYVPNGIDLARFQVTDHAPRDGLVVGTVAALRAEKNLGRLLRAFRLMADAMAADAAPPRLVIAGDGPERPGLEALAAELGLADRVGFIGHVSEPQHLYRGFDVFALSSDTEQMPLSVLEAMAAGLPVAATDVGDIRDMLCDGNRALVTPPTDAALAVSLGTLATQPELRRAIGAANRAKAERDFDQEDMFRAYAALFDGPG